MNDGIYFADPNEPFRVWVRVRTADKGYRWVLREARPGEPPAISDPEPSKGGKEGS